ncbi:hypothetical protein [Streptomyces mirabilis]|uniref:hypothetical protein n=1 Tax=Streptomyces mirabilis TaxID=68239 RepID=UPI0036A45BC3
MVTINGRRYVAPATVAAAIAPWAGASLAETLGGYPRLFTVFSVASIAAVTLAAVSSASGSGPTGASVPAPEI